MVAFFQFCLQKENQSVSLYSVEVLLVCQVFVKQISLNCQNVLCVVFISTSLLEAMPNSFTETSKLNLCHNHIKFVAMYREAKLVIFHVHKLIVFFKVLILHNSSLNTVDLTMF